MRARGAVVVRLMRELRMRASMQAAAVVERVAELAAAIPSVVVPGLPVAALAAVVSLRDLGVDARLMARPSPRFW